MRDIECGSKTKDSADGAVTDPTIWFERRRHQRPSIHSVELHAEEEVVKQSKDLREAVAICKDWKTFFNNAIMKSVQSVISKGVTENENIEMSPKPRGRHSE